MGVSERREREKAQRRSDIVDAAERVFFSKGVGEATMDDVAEAAELSKGTLYLYFKSKEDLYLATIARGLAILKTMFEDAVACEQRGIEKVAAVGRAYVDFCRKHPDYFNALLYFESRGPAYEGATSSSDCAEESQQVMEICANAVKIGIEDGTIRGDLDPVKTALTLYGVSTGILQIISIKGPTICEQYELNPDTLLGTFFDLIERSLRVERKDR